MKAKEFLPEIVLRHDREKPWQEWLPGTVLFADVSGFTPMSEALSVLGAEGAEILTDILNRYFAAMIGVIHAHGGQVMKFGGDAIQCFFPENGDWHMRSKAEACLSPLSRKTGTGTSEAKRRRACPRFPVAEGGREDAGDVAAPFTGAPAKAEAAIRTGDRRQAAGGGKDAADVAAPFRVRGSAQAGAALETGGRRQTRNVAAPFRVRPSPSPFEKGGMRGISAQAAARDVNNSKFNIQNSMESSLARALHAAKLMQERMPRFQNIKTPVKKFALKMKIGIAQGEVLLAGVGDPNARCDYVFAGAPVDAASEAEHHASAGEIVLKCSRRLQPAQEFKVQSSKFKVAEIEPGFWRILGALGEPAIHNSQLPRPSRATGYRLPATASSYLISEVHAMVSAGYAKHVGALLDIVPIFMNFKGFRYTKEAFDLQRFDGFFRTVMDLTRKYDGRLNRISMGDKGSTFFILFGAPNPLEKKEELAAQWALDVRAEAGRLFSDISIRIGMSAGRVFAGIVGGAGRAEYTVMGDTVNLSARLMQEAESAQSCLSQAIIEKIGTSFECLELGKRQLKGKVEPLVVYALTKKRRTTRVLRPQGAMAGRTQELRTALDRIALARKGRPGMLVLEGEPGVGKSYLAEHILGPLDRKKWNIWPAKGEISRQSHAYAPWLDILTTRLFEDRAPDWPSLKAACGPRGEVFLTECAALLHVPVPRKYRREKSDQETRKRLFHNAFVEWIMENASRTPLLIFLDDLHWFDTLSLELLTALMNRIKSQPLFILAASRPGWNKKEFENRPAFQCIFLSTLNHEDLRHLAQDVLSGKAHDLLVSHLHDSTQGNPFFARQYLNYLNTEKALEQRLGEWRIRRGMETRAPASAGDIVMAQLNVLTLPQKLHLQMASCIGPAFSKDVLAKAMKPGFLQEEFDALARHGVFMPLPKGAPNSNTHAFPHAIIQETAYRSLPSALRKRNHKRVGLAIESSFAGNLPAVYPNLSDHFTLAGVREKALAYSLSAGKALYDILSFPESVVHLERAWGGLRRSRDKRTFTAGLMLSDAYIRTGRYSDCIKLARRIQRGASHTHQKNAYYRAILSRFDAMQRMGDYAYYLTGLKILRMHQGLNTIQKAMICYFLGISAYRRGLFPSAEDYFLNVIKSAFGRNAEVAILSSFMFLASMARKRNSFLKAFKYIGQSMELAEQCSNDYQALRLDIEYANILMDNRQYLEARTHYFGLIVRAEDCGDNYLLAGILLNIGDIEQRLCNWRAAKEYLGEAAGVFESLNANGGRAAAYSWMGAVLFHEKKYEEAYAYYFSGLQLLEKANEMTEACHGYFNLAEVCLKLNRVEEAKAWHQKGINSFRPEDNPELHTMFMRLREQMEAKPIHPPP